MIWRLNTGEFSASNGQSQNLGMLNDFLLGKRVQREDAQAQNNLLEEQMAKRKLSFTVDEAIRGTGHGGKVDVRVLINEETCGSKGFSLLVNTMKARDSRERADALGHKHEIEHGVFGLKGHGKVVVGGEEYDLMPGTAVYVPANEMHYVANQKTDEDLTYIIIYVPAGEEKLLLAKG